MNQYRMPSGNKIIGVYQVLGGRWATCERIGGSLYRVKSKALPICDTAQEAQTVLDAWAARWGLEAVK